MNATTNERKPAGHGWHELTPAELRVIQGGSPTLPLPPPSALRFIPDPPEPWRLQVVSLGGYLLPPQPC